MEILTSSGYISYRYAFRLGHKTQDRKYGKASVETREAVNEWDDNCISRRHTEKQIHIA